MNQARSDGAVRNLKLLSARTLGDWLSGQSPATRDWLSGLGFVASPGSWCPLPVADGAAQTYLFGVSEQPDLYALAAGAHVLPDGSYRLDASALSALDAAQAALGFALGRYQFTRYKKPRRTPARLEMPDGVDADRINGLVQAVSLVRDLVNTPSEDMGPAELAAETRKLAAEFGAQTREWVGDELLAANFPAIHAVGRASHRPPRLIELTAGDADHPRLAIVGKGVCFDTGGLDIKSADGMRWMKKDMGGAAHALALARLVLAARLPVRLQLLIPAVENAIGPNSYRPGEVIRTRAGLSVEIDNTDAEGRVVLCDALAYAGESQPELIFDFATLTGAARVALGPELPPFFTNRDEIAVALMRASRAVQDPLWQMPLWHPYLLMLESSVADLANSGSSRMAGAITAALYLERFVPAASEWCHIDCYAWNDSERPGRPRGGEAQGLRAAFAYLSERYRR